MADALPSIIVTGISGNLGRRLLPMLSGFRVVGVDFRPPETDSPLQFVKMDFSLESSCLEMIHLLREVRRQLRRLRDTSTSLREDERTALQLLRQL